MIFTTIGYKPLYLKIIFITGGLSLLFILNYAFFFKFSPFLIIGVLFLGIWLWRFTYKQKYVYKITPNSCIIHVGYKKIYTLPFEHITHIQLLPDNRKITFFPYSSDTIFWTSSGHHLVCITLKDGKSIVISPRRLQEFIEFLKRKIPPTAFLEKIEK